jgi:hypothetical protein
MTKIKIRVVLLAIGIYYVLTPALGLISSAFQMQISEITPENTGFTYLMKVLDEIWNYYFPLLMLIGGGYLLFSLFYPRIKKFSLLIHTILTFALAIWCYYYILSGQKFIQILLENTNAEFEMFSEIVSGAYTFGVVGLIIMYAIPQIAIAIVIIFKRRFNAE